LGYITRLRVPDAQRVAFVSQLFRSHHGHFSGQDRHNEVVMTQLEVIRKSLTNVRIGFFCHLDMHQFRLAGRWLYYGLYLMLVLTSGGSLMTGELLAHKLGGFRIVYQMMRLVSVELQSACKLGRLDNQFCPYHYDLRDFVGLAVRVMRVCHWQVGLVADLTIVRDRVRDAEKIFDRAFVRWRPDPNGIGLCPICQDGFELGGYGVPRCGHVMHLHCWLEYEAYEHCWAPHHLPRCFICAASFEGFQCICL
jgi:hypothetical protein